MPLSVEQNTFLVMAYFRSGTQDEFGAWNYSSESTYAQFMGMYPDEEIPFYVFVQLCERVVERFLDSGSVVERKSTGRSVTIVTKESIQDVNERMQRSPNKSITRLSQQTGISYGSCHTILKKKLHMHPYK